VQITSGTRIFSESFLLTSNIILDFKFENVYHSIEKRSKRSRTFGLREKWG